MDRSLPRVATRAIVAPILGFWLAFAAAARAQESVPPAPPPAAEPAPAPEPAPVPEPPVAPPADPAPAAPAPHPAAAVLAHGGAGTRLDRTPDVVPAVEAAWKVLAEGGTALDAAVAAAVVLEDNPNLNAGSGSNIRMDGETVQMDAAVMDERGRFGSVAVIERVKNPVLVARAVMDSPHLMLAGDGAERFARTLGFPEHDPRTPESLERYAQLLERIRGETLGAEWREFDWKARWNFPKSLADILVPKDTIGVVARDGKGGMAVAISTGGTSTTLDGRVGDVPIMGAGSYAGPAGAVCTTGWGEYIVRESLARRVYDWIAEGVAPAEAIARGLALYPAEVGIGIIAVSADGQAAASNTSMAWAGLAGGGWMRADAAPAEAEN